jgi:F0F1-type ATP synthase assembly protein I
MQQTQNLDAHRAKRILVAQVIATLVVTLLALAFGLRAGLFAFIGGATATTANGLFAYWVFGRYRADEPGRLLGQIYGGELMKLAFIVAAFVAALIWLEPPSPLPLFGAFFVVQVFPPLLANRIAG